MIVIKRTHDMDLVRSILTNRRIYGYMADDFSPKRQNFKPKDHPSLYYLIPYHDGGASPLGSILFTPMNSILYQVHIGILPEYWGKSTRELSAKAIEWMAKNTRCKKIMTMTPATNKLAQGLAKRCGFVQEGLIKYGALRHGVLEDLVILGRLV